MQEGDATKRGETTEQTIEVSKLDAILEEKEHSQQEVTSLVVVPLSQATPTIPPLFHTISGVEHAPFAHFPNIMHEKRMYNLSTKQLWMSRLSELRSRTDAQLHLL
jgi:hypothetical protein